MTEKYNIPGSIGGSVKNYSQKDHTHCYDQKNPPCGIKGIHCCLCDICKPQMNSKNIGVNQKGEVIVEDHLIREDWEKEFHEVVKKFKFIVGEKAYLDFGLFKSFIEKLLSSQKKKIIEGLIPEEIEVNYMKGSEYCTPTDYRNYGWNSAREWIINQSKEI